MRGVREIWSRQIPLEHFCERFDVGCRPIAAFWRLIDGGLNVDLRTDWPVIGVVLDGVGTLNNDEPVEQASG
jgi:hypothetical protein